MNFKLKALVAAVAMAASMSASADVATSASGNGEMTFQIWDATVGSESSYTLDTGLSLNSFLSGVTTNQVWNFALDTTYTNWFSGLSAAAQAGLQWNVSAGDNVGAQTYITTAPLTFDSFTGSTSFTNSQARSLGTALDIYLGGVNAAMPGTVATNSSVQINGKANTGYAGNLGGNWGSKQTLINTAGSLISSELNLYKIAAVATGGASTPSTWTQQKFGGSDYSVKFNGSNVVISAVPEADTSAMMLAGLGLMGFIARRRSSKVA